MTIFCRPEEMLQLASAGGEAMRSADRPAVIWTLDGLDRAALTSRRIRGKGPSLEAALCEKPARGRKTQSISQPPFDVFFKNTFLLLCCIQIK